jgi:drug/metabolite transporter (DMT)-like permease
VLLFWAARGQSRRLLNGLALAVVLAAILLAEPIRPGQVVGGIVIVAGVLVTRGGLPFRVVRAAA